ncbi:MAG: hypothetical protein SV775_16465, partial [Thermodesulfobacteriota bacterium]|nr:hypothetical protein [Thermodesulfobacteriota bacterium]
SADTVLLRQTGMQVQMAAVTVNGDQKTRLDGFQHDAHVFTAVVTGNVHLGQPSINDVGAAFKQVVEHPTHIFFVALDGVAGDENDAALWIPPRDPKRHTPHPNSTAGAVPSHVYSMLGLYAVSWIIFQKAD